MSATAIAEQAFESPLRRDDDHALRVGTSNVLLEMVLHSFRDGATPEAIVQRFPTLSLADTYAVVAMYLKEPAKFEAYLLERRNKGDEVMRTIEATQSDLSGIRARLLAGRR